MHCKAIYQSVSQFQPAVPLKDVDEAYAELMRFADPADAAVLTLTAKRAAAHQQFGIAIRCLNKVVEDGKGTQDLHKALYELADLIGWDHVATHLRNDYLVRYCIADRLF